jgi:hypothetical protein
VQRFGLLLVRSCAPNVFLMCSYFVPNVFLMSQVVLAIFLFVVVNKLNQVVKLNHTL